VIIKANTRIAERTIRTRAELEKRFLPKRSPPSL
jgi:hypothetical protein